MTEGRYVQHLLWVRERESFIRTREREKALLGALDPSIVSLNTNKSSSSSSSSSSRTRERKKALLGMLHQILQRGVAWSRECLEKGVPGLG
jgi:DNA-binding IclR family transcriptional regulator